MQKKEELNEFIKLLTQVDNPVYVSLFVILLVLITVYFFLRYVLIPKERIFKSEKEKLEFRNTQLLALFSELNPDPLLRLDHTGIITHSNSAARNLKKNGSIIGEHINTIIPEMNFDHKNLINKYFHGVFSINNRIYSGYVKLVPEMILLFLRDITEETEYQIKLKESADRAQELLELERERIAIELHDDVGQNLSFARLILMKKQTGNKPDYSDNSDEKLQGILDNAINSIKNISYNLKPRILAEMGLAPAIRTLCNDASHNGDLKVAVDILGNIYRLPPQKETSLYRMCQEALNNVVKHAKATECNIRIHYHPTKIMMIIADNGVGMQAGTLAYVNGSSLGLFNMKNRVESLNGTFKIETEPGQGTILFIEIPAGDRNIEKQKD